DVVARAEALVRAERSQTRAALAALRQLLLGAILGLGLLVVLIGLALARRVVAPLKAMEISAAAVGVRARERLAAPSPDRAIVSVTEAFNRMLKEIEFRQASLMRSERLAALGTLLAGVAHELNNPLSNISSSCQILLEEKDTCSPATLDKHLTRIDLQTGRARGIVRALQEFSRDRAFQKSPVRLKPLVSQTVGFVRGEVPATATVDICIADDLVVLADAQRLQQALLNLIRNALQAVGPNGQVRVSAARHPVAPALAGTALGRGCGDAGPLVEIRVEDDGPGVAPELLPRVFDPFFTTKDVGQGMGLGLFVAEEIVDAHDGCIAVESVPGQGACFLIRLPDAPVTGMSA
ncbi:MAG: HAMP domain-containing histidine kinase, partial [Thiobacillus sp.]|nr:HAMP domain-containing histidine kinase [Thiobacillus sp.]